MGLTSALFTGLSGLNSSQFRLDVIGDNIANLNTTGFKGSRTSFQTVFSQTINGGTKPSTNTGGTNPTQVGLGSTVGSIQRLFNPGSIETTGVPSDLAIEGNGFFVLRTPENERVFTRDGGFTLSANNNLITQDGFFVQGYGVNSDFELQRGSLTDLQIPLGTLTTARATTRARFEGTLNSGGEIATAGSVLQSQVLNDPLGAAAVGTTLLTDLRNPSDLVTPLLANGDAITLDGVMRGGRELATASFTVGTDGTTVDDFLGWLNDVLGINEDAGVPGSPGVSISGGQFVIRGNVGTANALTISDGTLISSNPLLQVPFTFTQSQAANGTSVHTAFTVYDSIGSPVEVDVVAVLEARTTGSSTWRFYATSPDDSDADIDLGTISLSFDERGTPITPLDTGVLLNRVGTGAIDPLVVQLDFANLRGLTVDNSALVMSFQDGFSAGTLIDYSVGGDGRITGTFSNGLTQTIGQVVLATFANPAGLVARGNNVFFVGANSGEAQISEPLVLGAGRILGGALELSNVDLSREFINMITASTSFSASSRVVSTSDQLLQELLLIARR
ncbi:MAG: flagellar hook-basal body complex protein [Phycisphaerae bacterium]|nr:flagellar hook-basal body complex protein [Phycisphaerae bacterium]